MIHIGKKGRGTHVLWDEVCAAGRARACAVGGAWCGMEASAIAEVTKLSEKHVGEVMRSLGYDNEKIAAALDQYLNSQSGPLKDGTEMADGWAESGKPRRPKKVRPCCLYGPANAARAATIGPARLACAAALRGSTHWSPHAYAQPGRARVAGLPDSRTCSAPSLSLTTPCALPVLRRRATRSPRVPRTRNAPKGKARRSDASATARAAAAVAGAVRDSRARAHLVTRPRRHEAPNPLRSALAPPPPPPPPSPTPPLPPPPERTARHHALSIPTNPTISAIPAIPKSLTPCSSMCVARRVAWQGQGRRQRRRRRPRPGQGTRWRRRGQGRACQCPVGRSA